MDNKLILVSFFMVFLVGCTSLIADDFSQSAVRDQKRGVQIEFNQGFPNQGVKHKINKDDSVQAIFLLRNYGDTDVSGTLGISDKHKAFNREAKQFELGAIKTTRTIEDEGLVSKDSNLIMAFAPFRYPKNIFDENSFDIVSLQMNYNYRTILSGEICASSFTSNQFGRNQNCQPTNTILERQLIQGGIHPISVEKIEKRTEIFEGFLRIFLDIHIKDFGGPTSFAVGGLNDFNLDLLSGAVNDFQCDRPPFEFDKNKEAVIRCSFGIADTREIIKIPFKMSFSYPYKVNKAIEISFEKE